MALKIVDDLAKHGLESDEKPVKQSDRVEQDMNALNILKPYCYECDCSRAELKIRPCSGECRTKEKSATKNSSLRIKTNDITAYIKDSFYGKVESKNIRDFILWRRDRLISYQLACSIDESIDKISHVVRGSDLIESTIMQSFLRKKLDLSSLSYGHFPILVDKDGAKLSKQAKSKPIHENTVRENFRLLAKITKTKKIPTYKYAHDWLDWFFDFGNPFSWLPKNNQMIKI